MKPKNCFNSLNLKSWKQEKVKKYLINNLFYRVYYIFPVDPDK